MADDRRRELERERERMLVRPQTSCALADGPGWCVGLCGCFGVPAVAIRCLLCSLLGSLPGDAELGAPATPESDSQTSTTARSSWPRRPHAIASRPAASRCVIALAAPADVPALLGPGRDDRRCLEDADRGPGQARRLCRQARGARGGGGAREGSVVATSVRRCSKTRSRSALASDETPLLSHVPRD